MKHEFSLECEHLYPQDCSVPLVSHTQPCFVAGMSQVLVHKNIIFRGTCAIICHYRSFIIEDNCYDELNCEEVVLFGF